jgi:hypothetical protein
MPIPNPNNGYPPAIGSIMTNLCSTTGCHDEVSKEAAAGLSLETWSKLFVGSRNNAAVVPFSAEQSFLMFFINTYGDLGPSIEPTMPYNANKLSKDNVIMIRDWIEQGAPNIDGEIAFSGDPNRNKIYIINQGCDNVAVLDYETLMIMRYFNIGASPTIESPHKTKISKDGLYYYVCFYSGDYLEKYSTVDETLVGRANIGYGSWNTFTITSDGKIAFVVYLDASGSIAVVDLR